MLPRKFQDWLNYNSAVNRSKRMTKGELLDHIDTSITSLGMQLSKYRQSPNDIATFELRQAAMALAVLADELDGRRKNNYI